MATLVSPGVSISIIDQSINAGAGPGTVPLIFIATQQDKVDPTGTGIASGTAKQNAGKIYSITSQRDLVSTFGDPTFYSISGSSLNGYPLNEYGLLAAYSYLGISNLARIVRADIDTKQLEPTPIQPTSPAAIGTYWLDESGAGSTYGLFVRAGVFPNEQWVAVTPKFVYNFTTGTTNTPPSTVGVNGDYAVIFQSASGILSYWAKITGSWVQLTGSGSTAGIIIQSVWPDLTNSGTTQKFWVKTTPPAQGANIVLRKMDATTSSFITVSAPILTNDSAADAYYSTDALGSIGQIYIEPFPSGAANSLEFRMSDSLSGAWAPLTGIIGSSSVPVQGPENGQLWFNSLLGLDSDGMSTVDILVNDGQDHWKNCKLPGYTLPGTSGNPTLYIQSADPRSNIPVPSLVKGDVWVDTDMSPYPVIKRWSGSLWSLVDNSDQTSPYGIIFEDARSNPLYSLGGYNGAGTGDNNGGGNNPDLDADAPQAALYPKGFLLWNTRYSTNNVKQWQSPYVYDGVTAQPDNTNNNSTGRWVTSSGNNPGGVPYMGTAAQQIMIVRAIQSTIVSNEEIRAEDMYFNLIAAPGYVEAIDEMLVLNEDRKNTAFVVGDTPFTLNASGTALQNWATNASVAYTNGADGLTSASKYFGVWYPSGLSTNVNGTDVVVPPSHMALRTIAYNDQVAYPWFAPAGLQRGVVNNAGSVGYVNAAGQYVPTKLNEGQRDILYNNGINPIRTMPTGGIVVFGQKTRQPYSSATDRINVVRLENYLRYQMNMLAQPFLFEPNDSTTRKAVKDAFDRFLSELITLRAVYDFLVVCDLSNNTPARIDRNELWIDVAIQPVKAVEFIYVPIRIRNTGSSLTIA